MPATGYQVGFYLYSEPNEHADVGQAQTVTSGPLRPSITSRLGARHGSHGPNYGSLRFPFDDNFHAKVIVSEYIALAHVAVQDARTQPGGWRYYSAPSWVLRVFRNTTHFPQHTSSTWTVVAGRLREVGATNQGWFACCRDGLPEISDAY